MKYSKTSMTFVLIICFGMVLGQSGHAPLRTTTHVEIIPTPEGNTDSTGNIINARNCGGPAKIIRWQYPTCTNTEGLCKVPGGGMLRQAELEFIPSEDIPALANRLVVIHNQTPKTVLDQIIPKSEVLGGRHYTLLHTAAPKKELVGEIITIKNIVYRLDNQTEACIEAEFEIV